jgi:asparagine synthase (glutamine-hydrolysing)
MFAFVLWDNQTRTLTAARDRLGVKPLHFERLSGGGLRLASEAQALLAGRAPGQPRRLHLDAFREWVVAPAFSGVERPLFDGLETLPAGHVLTWRAGQTEVKRWGGFVPMRGSRAEELVLDDIPRRVFMGVMRAAEAEVPLGVFLSGGFDSTLIAAVAGYQAEALQAFTVRFEGQADFDYARSQITFEDDSPFAAHALSELELDGHEVLVSRATLAGDLAAMACINDALPAWEQELAQHHLARAARGHVKAVLVGDAADETHFGYHFLLDPEATASPGALLARLGAPARLGLLAPELRDGLLEQLAGRYTDLVAEDGHGWGDRRAQLGATTSLLVKRWLSRLLHNGDIHTMAFGLEARVPFADTFLLDAAEQIGPEVGLKNGVEKWHLREAMDDVPERIRWRRKSALPKDQGAEPVYRAEAQKVLHEADAGFWRLLDRRAVEALVGKPVPLSELERAMLFQTVSLHHFVRHHALRSS